MPILGGDDQAQMVGLRGTQLMSFTGIQLHVALEFLARAHPPTHPPS
jgi:hypothetical protein